MGRRSAAQRPTTVLERARDRAVRTFASEPSPGLFAPSVALAADAGTEMQRSRRR